MTRVRAKFRSHFDAIGARTSPGLPVHVRPRNDGLRLTQVTDAGVAQPPRHSGFRISGRTAVNDAMRTGGLYTSAQVSLSSTPLYAAGWVDRGAGRRTRHHDDLKCNGIRSRHVEVSRNIGSRWERICKTT